ncbi:hypothetical protein RJ640_018086 [Escallonia rubra]|uniref:RNase H type-1 domain-containing protein n=1 Tax=Escallonia rubra TaxID=112253 RepID=A0AA88QNV1_9ASTE|nr:hypothetical protein RJ640_018086 [Escallonia rubra]
METTRVSPPVYLSFPDGGRGRNAPLKLQMSLSFFDWWLLPLLGFLRQIVEGSFMAAVALRSVCLCYIERRGEGGGVGMGLEDGSIYDNTTLDQSGSGGIGIQSRLRLEFLTARIVHLRHCSSAKIVEALAVAGEALNLASKLQMTHVSFEGDSLGVISLINNDSPSSPDIEFRSIWSVKSDQ